jgi:hypothetical protein
VATTAAHSYVSGTTKVPIPSLSYPGTLRSPHDLESDATGAFSAGDTPVPIPNTAVKTRSGDDTPMGESSSVPDYSKRLVNASLFGV